MKKLKANWLLVIFSFFMLSFEVYAQSEIHKKSFSYSISGRELKASEELPRQSIYKKKGHYSVKDWRDLIDAYWGNGLPTIQKLEIFDNAIETIDKKYAAFQNLEINLDSLRDHYRNEIEKGVSRGRFAGIMNHISLALKEAHSLILDIPVNFGTEPLPGVPLFVIGPWKENSRFGAVLTPLPDSSLLVYRALESQKLGLAPGDIVVGYDGIPWKKLYKELLEAELPIQPASNLASTDKSITHCMLGSAGLNWHLFDTIDVIKYNSNDTLHLSTAPLQGQTGFIWGNEQLPLNGVSFPDFQNSDFVSWGIIDNSRIGYIYVASWSPDLEYNISEKFYNAVRSLMYDYETDGLILDFRNNSGGYMGVAHKGYSLLFNEYLFSVAFDSRADDMDHFLMKPLPGFGKSVFVIPGDSKSFYNKPIAVLTGPGSISNGDFESWRMKLHPNAKLFGKPSCGAFATSTVLNLNNNDWFFYLTTGNSYPVNQPGKYMVHTELEIDEEVWLTKESVIKGEDDVVEKAVSWINTTVAVDDKSNQDLPVEFSLSQNYPNPFNPTTTIKYAIPHASRITLNVFNLLGQEVATLVNEPQPPDHYEIKFDAAGLSSGIYFYQLKAADFIETKKMVLLR